MRLPQPLHKGDLPALLRYLASDEANHAFFYTYLPRLDRPDVRFWKLDGDAQRSPGHLDCIEGCLCVSRNHACVSARSPQLALAFLPLLRRTFADYIVGTYPTISPLRPWFPERDFEHDAFCRLAHPELLPEPLEVGGGVAIRRASARDLPELIRFYAPLDFFVDSARRLPGLVRTGTVYVAVRQGRILSAAVTSTETDRFAVVNEVYTDPESRGRGLARACVGALCRDLLQRGLRVYLYYDVEDQYLEPFYGKLGFVKVSQWLMLVSDRAAGKGKAS